jgi:cation:H+ antiporter
MLITLILLAISIALLVKSSDYFVDFSSRIAQRVGISEFVIGLTLVALGTSLPELVSSVFASFLNNSDLVIGNILGSNVANIGLILGVGGMIMTIKVSKRTFKQDGMILIGATALFIAFMITGNRINRVEGLIMLAVFVTYTLYLLDMTFEKHLEYLSRLRLLVSMETARFLYGKVKVIGRIGKKVITGKVKKGSLKEARGRFKESILYDILIVMMSGVGIYIGAKYTVIHAIEIAEILNVPDSIIAFTLIAIGTSLPELSVTISSARKGLGDILMGNVIGSNIANMLLVGGTSSIINPLITNISYTMYAMIGFTLLLIIFMRSRWKLEKAEGITLLTLYTLFLGYIAFSFL